jgi:hypothetical protein
MKRFAKDLSLALDVSTAEAAKLLQTPSPICLRAFKGWI